MKYFSFLLDKLFLNQWSPAPHSDSRPEKMRAIFFKEQIGALP
ncbi:hypothetical protein Cabys_2300 [Caldithrix abyssi DSM 13497]|uniref:Uncharacterized protein n=1 Tax=Caldithrix abyssi DSM 13497 TaxID=880073 RepID=A0A1J1C9S9_CALAY|nr:hypothetical protein Cabys_2300 [Caldithrix abyssi DSM 13497]